MMSPKRLRSDTRKTCAGHERLRVVKKIFFIIIFQRVYHLHAIVLELLCKQNTCGSGSRFLQCHVLSYAQNKERESQLVCIAEVT